MRCPHCGEACPGYDTRRRVWRNLDAWGYKTFLVCNVPRVRCPEHGVVTIRVAFYEGLGEEYRAAVESVSMDTWASRSDVRDVDSTIGASSRMGRFYSTEGENAHTSRSPCRRIETVLGRM